MKTDDKSELLDAYITAHTTLPPQDLINLERKANVRLLRARMISGHVQGRLLKLIVAMQKPRNILEIGTYTGYASLCLAEGLTANKARVHTIESDDEIIYFIREALAQSPFGERVIVHLGDAKTIAPNLAREIPFDLVYIDANKREYADYYDRLIDLLPSGCIILADNTLWDGKVLEEVHKDVQTRAIAAFNDKIQGDERVENVILPLRDGLSIIRKR